MIRRRWLPIVVDVIPAAFVRLSMAKPQIGFGGDDVFTEGAQIYLLAVRILRVFVEIIEVGVPPRQRCVQRVQ